MGTVSLRAIITLGERVRNGELKTLIGMMQYDVTIIGAGIVGLATAFQLSEQRPELKIAVLDKEQAVATHQTGHNSGVIHSGIYYKPGGSKALNCLKGYKYLLAFCDKYEVPYEICGKVIVATKEEERGRLDKIFQTGQANGMEGLRMLQPGEVKEIEPHVRSVAAIWVPQAGIIHYQTVAEKYFEVVKTRGGSAYLGQKVIDIKAGEKETIVITDQKEIKTRLAINCAGLYSDKITALTMPEADIRILPFRGEYYELRPEKQHLVRNLIYPVPNPSFPFLGVHYTRMIKGGIEAGPNAVLAFKREGYSRWDVNIKELYETLSYPGFHNLARKYWRDGLGELHRSYSKKAFVSALQHLIPEVEEADLKRGHSGVRAMACDPNGQLIDDFLVLEKPGIINLCNAPSPAATASLAIGEMIANRALKKLTNLITNP